MSYANFLETKMHLGDADGFEPLWVPDFLFDFQKYLVEWAIRQGRAALFADCGMGKTPMQLVWAQNVVEHTSKPVLIITPLAVGLQTVAEAEKFHINAARSRRGEFTKDTSIFVTNYEQLDKFNTEDFAGVVCDESSAIKAFDSKRRGEVTEFMRRVPYRLLCTATPSPNDFHELGTSSEALGGLGYRDMLTMFFKQDNVGRGDLGWGRATHRFRGHAEEPFWRWVCSWARSCRKPSDLGFDDGRFILPPLHEKEIVVACHKPMEGFLFQVPAKTMDEHRQERRLSLNDRCARAAELIGKHKGQSIAWCHLNIEADLVEKMVPNALQVSGSMNDDQKEERMLAFAAGDLKVLVTKPKIGCWGMNFQNCSHQIMFPSDSFEQYYQAVRRSWRFGQEDEVYINIITTEGGRGVLENLRRKSAQADRMFESLTRHMNDSMAIGRTQYGCDAERIPSWL